MQNKLSVLMAQINPTVGALTSNRDKIIEIIKSKQEAHDVILFPELALTGYPPEDLLFRREFQQAVNEHLKQIQAVTKDCYVLVGHPTRNLQQLYNSVSIFHNGQKIAEYHKQNLPNYEIFDEARYFTPGKKNPCILDINHYKVGVMICEDLWHPGPTEDLIENGISVLLILNASPFDCGKYHKRESLLKSYAKRGISIIYVNQIGGQDELLFDGQSLAIDTQGIVCTRALAFEEDLRTVEIQGNQINGAVAPLLKFEPLIYDALVCGTRDYVNKIIFPEF